MKETSQKMNQGYNFLEDSVAVAVTYPEGFSYQYTGMGTQILAPKKWNIHLFTLLFCTTDYVSSF